MRSFSGIGVGLSFVFGFILVGLVAELYYLLYWKKRIGKNNNKEIDNFSFLFWWKRPNSFNSSNSSQELTCSVSRDLEMGSNKDAELNSSGEEGMENELISIHSLCGPPRFLFTIKEENKEDLESEDGKSRKASRTRSLSDLVFAIDGTPLSSPTIINSPSLESYSSHGFNPLFESLTEADFNILRTSPPPTFKFLKDAEDKFIKRLLIEKADKKGRNERR